MKTKKKIKVFVDGDILVYKIASATERSIDWGEDWWGLYADLKEARQLLDESYKTLLLDIIESYKYSYRSLEDPILDTKVVLSDPSNNWRTDILPSYKNNRAGKRKPVLWSELRHYLIDKYKAIIWPRLEADDVIGILATRHSIIASEDKDFQTIPCLLYQPSTSVFRKITKREADRSHLIQTLMGDSADGYKGCPGIGIVGAQRILQKGTWEEVVDAYTKAGLDEGDALTQARVAHILRSEKEYKKIERRVRLWGPSYISIATYI